MTEAMSDRLQSLRPLRVPTLPSFEHIERNLRRIMERYDHVMTPPEQEAARLIEEMNTRITGKLWQNVPMSFVTRVAAVAFSGPWRERRESEAVIKFLLDEIDASDRSGFLHPMVRIYIETFDPQSAHTLQLGKALSRAKSRIGARWGILVENLPDLFTPATVHKSLAGLMETMDAPWHGLRAIGLRHPHAPGLMDIAHLEFVAKIRPRLGNRQYIEKLLGWMKPDGQKARQTGAGAAIAALIHPWMERSPPKDIATLLTDRLTELYGHPKVNRSAVWNEVDPAMERVFLRWLMGADFRFLFRILTEVERGHMWPDREDFWWTMLEQGRVDELWVAFNEAGYSAALAKLPMDARQGSKRFGRQIGERDKSLLLMRVGNKIVVEGTYNFKVHIFPAESQNAPKLYQNRYDVADIRNSRGTKTVQHTGDWQTRVRLSL